MKDTMYLHPEMETLTRPEIEKLQLERLQKTVRHCMNSPFYPKIRKQSQWQSQLQ